MTYSIKLEGAEYAIEAMRKISALASVDSARQSFRQMGLFAWRRVKDRTPGSGTLREAWQTSVVNERHRMEYRIYNTLADKGVTYESTDGTTKPKLKTYPSEEQQTWGDVIAILDAGGKPHEITPKRVTWLSWWGTKSGGNALKKRFAVFSKHVSHPGHKAYGMITDTVKELDKLFEATVGERKRSILSAWVVKGKK